MKTTLTEKNLFKTKFHKFYEQNKDIINGYIAKEYQINNENFDIWINKQETKELIELSKLFKKYTTYIPYNTFIEKIKNICENDILKNKRKYTKIILFIQNNMDKSNFWISMLHYHYLNETKDMEIIVVTDSKKYIREFKNYVDTDNSKTLLIICDDASYTGLQINKFIMKYVHIIPTDISILLSIPYMSNYSKNNLTQLFNTLSFKKENILLSELTEIFYTFEENLINDNIYKKYEKYIIDEKIDIKKYTIFFNHKLPDMISIYQDIYAFGVSLKNNDNTEYPLSLIVNCDLTKFYDEWKKNIKKYDIQDVALDKICPYPFYKNFIYMYNNKIIKSLDKL